MNQPETSQLLEKPNYQTPVLTPHETWQIATGVSLPVGTNVLPESEGLQ